MLNYEKDLVDLLSSADISIGLFFYIIFSFIALTAA